MIFARSSHLAVTLRFYDTEELGMVVPFSVLFIRLESFFLPVHLRSVLKTRVWNF